MDFDFVNNKGDYRHLKNAARAWKSCSDGFENMLRNHFADRLSDATSQALSGGGMKEALAALVDSTLMENVHKATLSVNACTVDRDMELMNKDE